LRNSKKACYFIEQITPTVTMTRNKGQIQRESKYGHGVKTTDDLLKDILEKLNLRKLE